MMLESLRKIVQAVNAAENLSDALEIMVRRVREAMNTEVCSVYLRDPETNYLSFSANVGFNPDLVGKTMIEPGEGLVGLVAQREEPLNIQDAYTHERFRYVPGLGEDAYHAFLGVPIIHQREVLGVLVVQQREARRFDEDEEAFLITMSAQLAGVIAHARATGTVDDSTGTYTARFKGIAGAPGIAMGVAVSRIPGTELRPMPYRASDDVASERQMFRDCVAAVRDDMRRIGAELAGQLPPEEHALFDVYLGMLDDSTLIAEVEARIAQGEWAEGAFSNVMIAHVQTFERMEDPYLKERAVDVRDLGRRVLSYMRSGDSRPVEYPDQAILVGEELTASMLGEIPVEKLVGLVSVKGSGNSHVAILARAMGIPTVMGAVDVPVTRVDGGEMIVDGYGGYVYLNPTRTMRAHFEAVHEEERKISEELETLRDEPSETRDGHSVPLWVNTGLMADVARSLDQGAQGVGLYRTEIPFLLRERFPSEEEQRLIYREQLLAFAPLPVTMRTLDVGGDKALPYFPISEENPFLGWRGIRVTLDHPEIFLGQVRAMLKANIGLNNLRLLLPMISNVEELEAALVLIYRCQDELIEEGFDLGDTPPIGVMVEVPSAVYQARQLARRVDFLSVGSNDLTQYLLAVDRNNSRVADLYHAYHPSVLQALKIVADGAHAEQKPVGICGEFAGDPGAVLLLMAMGYDMLSMNASSLLRVKSVIRGTRLADARRILDMALRLESSSQVQELLRGELASAGFENLMRPSFDPLVQH